MYQDFRDTQHPVHNGILHAMGNVMSVAYCESSVHDDV